jgi:hypothetical protein
MFPMRVGAKGCASKLVVPPLKRNLQYKVMVHLQATTSLCRDGSNCTLRLVLKQLMGEDEIRRIEQYERKPPDGPL